VFEFKQLQKKMLLADGLAYLLIEQR